MPTTPISTEDQLKQAKKNLRLLKKQLKHSEHIRSLQIAQFNADTSRLKAAINDTADKMLPQKQMLLKELSYLVNATSRAVRTTMWSMASESRRGGR